LIFGADTQDIRFVTLDGSELSVSGPRDALDAGIAYLTEDRKGLGLFLDMTISENINIGVIGRRMLSRRYARLRCSESALPKSDFRAFDPHAECSQSTSGRCRVATSRRL
jgi:ABC-type sugar transport system ATPase subunit